MSEGEWLLVVLAAVVVAVAGAPGLGAFLLFGAWWWSLADRRSGKDRRKMRQRGRRRG